MYLGNSNTTFGGTIYFQAMSQWSLQALQRSQKVIMQNYMKRPFVRWSLTNDYLENFKADYSFAPPQPLVITQVSEISVQSTEIAFLMITSIFFLILEFCFFSAHTNTLSLEYYIDGWNKYEVFNIDRNKIYQFYPDPKSKIQLKVRYRAVNASKRTFDRFQLVT